MRARDIPGQRREIWAQTQTHPASAARGAAATCGWRGAAQRGPQLQRQLGDDFAAFRMSEKQKADLAAIFREAAENAEIIAARFTVLNDASASLARLADILQTSGWIGRDQKELAAALLIRIASELSSGIALLLQSNQIYSAGA